MWFAARLCLKDQVSMQGRCQRKMKKRKNREGICKMLSCVEGKEVQSGLGKRVNIYKW